MLESLLYSLGGNAIGIETTIVAHIAGFGYARAILMRITLVAINAGAVLFAHRIETADGIGAAVDGTAASVGHATIGSVPVEVLLALAHSAVAERVFAAVRFSDALRGKLTVMPIAVVATLTVAHGLTQCLVVVAGGVFIANFRFLQDKEK